MESNDDRPMMPGYHEVVCVPVQWGDQDALGHVNNTVFLRWFEIGRIAYLQRVGLSHDLASQKLAPILAAVSCSFRRQVTFPDRVSIGSRMSRIGTSSLVVEHAIFSERHQVVVAEGHSTIVHYDYGARKSCPIPDDIRRTIAEMEASASE